MKIPRILRHNKLWAATARRSSAASTGMDFEEMPEPNMKLSRALLIVLLLHVVRVGNYRIQRDQNPGEFVRSGILRKRGA